MCRATLAVGHPKGTIRVGQQRTAGGVHARKQVQADGHLFQIDDGRPARRSEQRPAAPHARHREDEVVQQALPPSNVLHRPRLELNQALAGAQPQEPVRLLDQTVERGYLCARP